MATSRREVPDQQQVGQRRSQKNMQREKKLDRKPTVLKHRRDEAKRMMGRVSFLMDTRLRGGQQTDDMVKPVIPRGQLYADPDFPFHVAMEGEESINEIQWMRPPVSFGAKAQHLMSFYLR